MKDTRGAKRGSVAFGVAGVAPTTISPPFGA